MGQGTIYTISKGFAVVEGLPTANLGALVHFTSTSGAKVPGLVTSMDHQRCSVAVLSASELLRPGDRVSHFNEVRCTAAAAAAAASRSAVATAPATAGCSRR